MGEYRSLVCGRQSRFWQDGGVSLEEVLAGVITERKARLIEILIKRGMSEDKLAIFFTVLERDRSVFRRWAIWANKGHHDYGQGKATRADKCEEKSHRELLDTGSKVYRSFIEMEQATFSDSDVGLRRKEHELIATDVSVQINCEPYMQ